MPKLLPIQHTFDAGELSPLFGARSDLGVYSRGFGHGENMFPVAQGPVFGRGGTTYINSFTGVVSKVFGFQETWHDGYSVSISDDGNMHITDEIEELHGPELVVNYNYENGLAGWTPVFVDGSVTVTNALLSLLSTTHVVRGEVSVYQHIETFQAIGAEFHIIVNMLDDGVEVDINVGTTPGAGDLYTITTTGTNVAAHFTATGVSDFWVSAVKAAGTSTEKRINSISIRVDIVTTGDSSFAHPWANDLKYIHAVMPPGEDKMYFTHPNFPPQVLEHTGPSAWSFGPVVFTSQPAAWTGTTYPRTLGFFKGRSYWGAPGETFTASMSGFPLDLTLGTLDGDAFSFTIAERGEIVWILPLKNLIIGTRTGEHIVTSEGKVITPTDVDVVQQSAYGSNHCQPIKLGSKGVYVTSDGKRVQDIGYQWTAEAWLSTELNYTATHFTANAKVEELGWAQSPNKQIFATLSDGSILLCNYEPEKEIIGWVRVTTLGFIQSMSKLSIGGEDHYIGAVNRNVVDGSGNPLQYLELWQEDSYLDSSRTEFDEAGKSTIDDGAHLANRTVKVKIDGAMHPDVTLDVDGKATLNYAGNNIVYGLTYTQSITLLGRDFPYESGSTTSLKKRWNKIWVRVLSSVIPYVGSALATGDRSPQTPMNIAEGMKTTDIQVSILGYNKGEVQISTDLPHPLTVVGVFGEMSMEKV